MEQTLRPDLSINGVGDSTGGQYRSVDIEGVGRVNGDVQCVTFRANGVVAVRGSIEAQQFEANGKLAVIGGVRLGTAVMEGAVKIGGRLQGDDIQLSGLLKLSGDCEAETFDARGGLNMGGLLNAGNIRIKLNGRGRAKEIGGEHIQVMKDQHNHWSRLIRWAIPALKSRLSAQLIEGDEIRLEATTADIVRGNRVKIGIGCRIGLVEYRSELIMHPDAKVAKRIRI